MHTAVTVHTVHVLVSHHKEIILDPLQGDYKEFSSLLLACATFDVLSTYVLALANEQAHLLHLCYKQYVHAYRMIDIRNTVLATAV